MSSEWQANKMSKTLGSGFLHYKVKSVLLCAVTVFKNVQISLLLLFDFGEKKSSVYSVLMFDNNPEDYQAFQISVKVIKQAEL